MCFNVHLHTITIKDIRCKMFSCIILAQMLQNTRHALLHKTDKRRFFLLRLTKLALPRIARDGTLRSQHTQKK